MKQPYTIKRGDVVRLTDDPISEKFIVYSIGDMAGMPYATIYRALDCFPFTLSFKSLDQIEPTRDNDAEILAFFDSRYEIVDTEDVKPGDHIFWVGIITGVVEDVTIEGHSDSPYTNIRLKTALGYTNISSMVVKQLRRLKK